MCGRFSLTLPTEAMAQLFGVVDRLNLPARFNIAPTTTSAVIRPDRQNRRRIHDLKWGLVPSWARDMTGAARHINARSETVTEKSTFRDAFARRRCLIPADGFYEWKKLGDKKREAWRVTWDQESAFAFAGIWERFDTGGDGMVDTFCILTAAAPPLTAHIHPRTPVILPPDAHDAWLSRDTDVATAQSLARPMDESRLTAYRVDPRVGSVKHDDPGLHEPWEEIGELF